MSDRDYLAEMNDVIERAIPEGDYVAALVADELVEKLLASDRDLLTGWLVMRAKPIVTDVIRQRCNSDRSTYLRNQPRKAFGEAAKDFADTGNVTVMKPWSKIRLVVNDENLRRPIPAMNAQDCFYVADGYHKSKQAAAMEEVFWRSVRKKIGTGVIGDFFSEEQFKRMYVSVTGKEIQSMAA